VVIAVRAAGALGMQPLCRSKIGILGRFGPVFGQNGGLQQWGSRRDGRPASPSAASSETEAAFDGISAVIPLRDDNPTDRFPLFTLAVAVACAVPCVRVGRLVDHEEPYPMTLIRAACGVLQRGLM